MQIVQCAYYILMPGWLQGLVLASCLLVQADSEAFFLPGLLSRSSARPRPLGHAHTRHHHTHTMVSHCGSKVRFKRKGYAKAQV